MPRALRQYVFLAILLASAFAVQAGNTAYLIQIFRHGANLPADPFNLIPGTRTIAAGPLHGDQILAIDGHPFHAGLQFRNAVSLRHPGDKLRLTLSQPDGRAIEREVTIPDQAMDLEALSDLATTVALNLAIPIVSLVLGFLVAAVRPRDGIAWIVLFLMIGFTETVRTAWWHGPVPDLVYLWTAVWRTIFPVALLYFGIYFPTRSARDKQKPWLKYVFVLFFGCSYAANEAILEIWRHDISLAQSFHWLMPTLTTLRPVVLLVANLGFFANIRRKRDAESSPDGRRRLSILRTGSWVAIGPVVLLTGWAILTDSPLFAGVPIGITAPALLLLTLFPLVLFYVIVVERAMDLSFVIRSGLKYGFVRFGLSALRVTLIAIAGYVFFEAASRQTLTAIRSFQLLGLGAILLILRRGPAERASNWIDRQFFREAYNAEQVLAGLASEVGRYLESKPLLERVAMRIGETLHVADIVILLRQGDTFHTTYTTRPGEPMDVPFSSNIVQNLKGNEPLPIYFDNPPEWLRALTTVDLQTLDFMRTQLLLPLSGREGLAGIMSLGQKRSEAPYSDTDMRLLQAVAWQTGMALENSRLMASLAVAAAQRERVVRELEIAREVQERLFPQRYPSIPGVEFAGYCRPALGVGGDYYDFIELPRGRVGIAIGDVSGKGIAAALLMASLQASLRSQAIADVGSEAELMSNINQLIYDASTSSRYATLFYGEYEPVSRQLRYVNAGHNAPMILRRGISELHDEVIRLETGGPVVGLLQAAKYDQATLTLEPGDILLAFTDGVCEALNEDQEEWDEVRMIDAAHKACSLDPARMIQSLFREADEFTGKARQYDDMTLVVMKLR
jgi:sigma-B regulation protein RsbU (phosphoserine phosphatase)